MNQGPLPGMGGLPRPLHDTADAKINYNSTLLGDLEPYAYGKPGYLSSQTSYLNIPHRIQKIVPPLWLPEPANDASFKLSHPVDEGDVAFVMRLNRNSEVCSGLSNKSVRRAGFETAVDPFINLCTLNYILAGLQICTEVDSVRNKWDNLMNHLDPRKFSGKSDQKYDFNSLLHVVENLIRPFGIVHGKDKQGGQSETDMSSVQWPVSFVASMVLDGKDADLVNIWHNHEINAGDDLVLRLKIMPLPPGNKYTLNHYREGVVEKTFPISVLREASKNANGSESEITHVWQLVPDIFSFDLPEEMETLVNVVERGFGSYNMLNRRFFSMKSLTLPWQHIGYWHIARTQVHSKKYGHAAYYYNDMALNLRLGHIDSTFQPDFCLFSYPKKMLADHYKKLTDYWKDIVKIDTKTKERLAELMKNVVENEGFESVLKTKSMDTNLGKRQRQNTTLHLEGLDSVEQSPVPAPIKKQQIDDLRSPVHPSLLAGLSRMAAAKQSIPPPESSVSVSAAEEDIGVFDDPGPVPSRVSFEEQVPTFTVPKPSLKAKKSAKGKGVVSSVLGADGSIRQEQSRML